MESNVLQLDVQVLSLLASTVIPGLVAWWAKRRAPSWFKATVNAVLSIAAGAASLAVAADGKVELWDWIMQALITYGMSELAYQRLWKPTGAAEVVQEKLPGGIGPEEVEKAPAKPRRRRRASTTGAPPPQTERDEVVQPAKTAARKRAAPRRPPGD